MAEFASLWVGRPLSKIEQTCLASFVYHKHSMVLFVYDMDLAVPKGVIKRDAREILTKDKIFKTDNSYGPFADMFRYNMIQKTGLTWTDTDNICLQNRWRFPDYIFGMQGGPHKIIANGILRAPKNSPIIKDLASAANNFDKSKIKWGEIGPQLLTKKVSEYKLNKYIQEPQVFYPVNYWEWQDLFDPKKGKVIIRKTRNSHTVQIWHQMLNREGFDKDNFPKGSAMDYFYKRYIGDNI